MISVIVPVYKVEPYLRRCVDSILAQTFTDFELILVDDGSPDGCPAICDEYAEKDRRIRVIHKKNGGVSQARNTALEIVNGQYIMFCDSDDYWEKDWLEALYVAMADSNVDCVSASYSRVNVDGGYLGIKERETGIFEFRQPQEKIAFLATKILGSPLGWEVTTRIFKTDIIRRNHIRFCETCGSFAEDMGFVLEYMLYCDFAKSIESFGYCYMQREDSMMHKSMDIIKLDSMNEISKQAGARYFALMGGKVQRKQYSILHFLIMYCQYNKMANMSAYPYMADEIRKICDKEWYFKQTKALFTCYPTLKCLFGKDNARRILLFASYCLHRNWRLYQLESAFYYKVIGKHDESNHCDQ